MKLSETFWLSLIGHTQTLSILTGVILFLLLPKQKKHPYLELGLILIISLTTETIASIGVFIYHTNMNLAANIFKLFNLPLVILMYRRQINWPYKNIISYSFIAAFEVFALINLFFLQGPYAIDSYTTSLSAFCIILMAMTYLFAYDADPTAESKRKPPMHWINIAFLFYYSVLFFINLWVDYIVNTLGGNLIQIWTVHNSIGVVFYLTLAYTLLRIKNEGSTKTLATTPEV